MLGSTFSKPALFTRSGFYLCLLPGVLLPILFLLGSCADPKKLVYFPNQQDTTIRLSTLPAASEQLIQENDLLSITVNTLSTEVSAILNAPNAQVLTTNSGLGSQAGFLVSSTGYITYPFLGQVKAAGLTIAQLTEKLKTEILARQIALDPIITIRQLNYHITVIGEVGRPGTYTIPSEKVNLLEALAQGGDLTPYANRKTVAIIREENGIRQFHRVDLNSSKLLTSPYYYLKANDIVIAEPNKYRAANVSNQSQIISYAITAFSIVLTIVTFIISINR